jgi:homoserine dehydrogenase
MAEIGVLGMGNVGTGVVEVLSRNRETIERRLGTALSVKKVLVRDLGRSRTPLVDGKTTDCPDDILGDTSISVVVELMGGCEPALSYIRRALAAGKSVVTANKEVMSRYGKELLELAHRSRVHLLFEGSVAGGIPIIRPLRESLVANEVSSIMGILNGTTNFILTRMDEDFAELDEALKEAQRLGYAESDPTDDVSGADVARKIAILASMAFERPVLPDAVDMTGLERISLTDLRYARELGFRVKLIGYALRRQSEIEIAVAPMLLPIAHPLAAVRDSYNAVLVEGDAVGTLMFYGRGAGGEPTASAVVSDIIEALRKPPPAEAPARARPGLDLRSCKAAVAPFYIRLRVEDKPGVLAAVSAVFGQHGVSLSMVLQKERANGLAELVIVTHEAPLGALQDALIGIASLDVVSEVASFLRVWR